ncbi:hypothetical protein [Candidatus Tisiphia endosymbiont of Ceraclea dissimilis]|uniref:hypothetical protein n=1 Tax=Candidatus Tisiphia endosymbiont of Ceraclea dissimilis TaxID=3077928 RepID=UPI003CCB6B39
MSTEPSLLHDTIEDTTLTEEMITRLFDKRIASQVVDLTRACHQLSNITEEAK